MAKAEDYRKRTTVLGKRMRQGPTLPTTRIG